MSSGDKRPPTAADLLGADMPAIDQLLCDRSEKARLESAGNLEQLRYIGYLVEQGCKAVRESHVLEFQKLAITGIYPCAGRYRSARDDVYLRNASHQIPDAAAVPGLVREALDHLERARASESAVDRAAYALWRFNWIHPFAGGNGRTARAIAYLILCIDIGGLILGSPTVPVYIAARTDDYESALREADAAELVGKEELGSMKWLVLSAVVEQMSSVLKEEVDS